MVKNITSKKNVTKMWLIAIISAILVLNTVFFIVYASANKYVWDEITIENEYLVGDTITVPNVNVTADGKSYPAEFVLKHPNGKSYADEDNNLATESKYIFETPGIYKLLYIANVEGKTVATEKSFEVKEQLFSVSSKNSSVAYGVDSSMYQSGKVGLNLTLASGDHFKYGKVIDFNGKTSSDKIITIIALPEVRGEMEVSGLLLTLTDAYDPNNYVEVQIKNSTNTDTESAWDWTYCSAAAPNSGQVSTGIAPGGSPVLQVNTPFGRSDYFSFHGQSFYYDIYKNNPDKIRGKDYYDAPDRDISISMDYASRQLFVDGNLICDLDDEYYFNNLWDGFVEGKAFLKVEAITSLKEKAHFLFTNVMGQEMDGDNVLEKDADPTFVIEDLGLDLDNLSTVAGYKFPVFKATAKNDYNSISEVTVKAYTGYYSSTKNEIEIVDGYISPTKLGLVTLEYSVTEFSGKVYKKLIDVTVYKDATIDVNTDGGYATSCLTGEVVPVANCVVDGNIGKAQKTVTVTFGESSVAVTDDTFKPIYEGNYNVTITYTDVIGQQDSVVYTVSVAKNPNPIFEENVIMPEYFALGVDYALPTLSAYGYYDGRVELASEIFVDDVKTDKANFTTAGDHVIKYVATSATGRMERIYNVKSIDVETSGKLDLQKFFVGENFTTSIDSLGVNFNTVENKDTTVNFINYLTAYEFSVNFVVSPLKTAYGSIEFVLTDIYDGTNTLSIRIDFSNMKVYVDDVDTGIVVSTTNIFDTTGKVFCEFSFDARTGTVAFGKEKFVVSDFKGFNENLVKTSIKMNGVYGESGFSIRKLVNQPFKSSIKSDSIEPSIVYNGTYNVYENLDAKITIFSAVASDVLSPLKASYVTVKDPNGAIVVADDGTRLDKVSILKDYSVTLTIYGKYSIEYYAEDGEDEDVSSSNTITVIDKEKPVITLNTKLPTTAKVGDKISVPTVTLTDNLSTDLKVMIFVCDPDNGLRTLLTEDKFQVTSVGKYEVSFMCIDDAGNLAFETYYITVTSEDVEG